MFFYEKIRRFIKMWDDNAFKATAEDFLLDAGYSKKLGARELQRTIEKHVQMPLSNLLLNGELKQHRSWMVSSEDSKIKIVPTRP